MVTKKTVFLDRDGTINVKSDKDYIKNKNEFIFVPGALRAISNLSKENYRTIVITNQQCIGKGLVSNEEMMEIHDYMRSEVEEIGGRIDRVYYCPHLEGTCLCRKPLPGMIDQAKKDFGISLDNSWFVGDSEEDILVGKSRGCKTIYVGSKGVRCDYRAKDLEEAVSMILFKDGGSKFR